MTAPARLLLGDSLVRLAELPDASVHAVVTDPPYGLEFMGKEWDRFAPVDAVRRSGWEHSATAATTERSPETPHSRTGVAFGQRRRTYRCTGCDRRDAFRNDHECQPAHDWQPEWVDELPLEALSFQEWARLWATECLRVLVPGGHLLAFGSPRTYHRLASGLEDAGFEIRDSIHWLYGEGFPKSLDVSKAIDKAAGAEREVIATEQNRGASTAAEGKRGFGGQWDVTAPATDEAREWAGWGTALKPSHEPIVMARKPLVGTVSENVQAHRAGALNIDACRVGTTGGTRQVTPKEKPSGDEATSYGASIGSASGGNVDAGGRWPGNVVLAHLPECKGNGPRHTEVLCAPGCPVADLNEMSGDLVPGASPPKQGLGSARVFGDADRAGVDQARVQLDGGGAARFFYIAKPRKRERIGGTLRNLHPTVKPVELMRWLVRLVTPPGGVVLDPFMGSGTTGCACVVEGAEFVGIEQDEDSFTTARERIADWSFAHGRERPITG